MEILERLFKKHKDWNDVVKSFGVNEDTAEDIVMEMYLRIDKYVKKGVDIMYDEDEVNYYYIYRTLKNLHYDLHKKESKIITVDVIDYYNYLDSADAFDYDNLYDRFYKELNKLHWYDRRVFDIVEQGQSCKELSRLTNISYASIYNTYAKVKKHLKKTLE